MKVIFLNIWAGKMHENLSSFISEHNDADVFCFQETHGESKELLRRLLPRHTPVFAEKKKNNGSSIDNAIFVKNGHDIASSQTLLSLEAEPGFVLYAGINAEGKTFHIWNVHGISRPGKLDNPARILQSQTILDHVHTKNGPKIIGGDFNVLPETQSIGMIKNAGYRELITEYKIPTTRNHFSWELYPGNELYYSDYVLTSPDVSVNSFTVPANEVSDHLPMIVEFV